MIFMAPHVHFHQCTCPIPLGHHRKVGFPPFTALVKLSYLVLLHRKSSKIDQVINFVYTPQSFIAKVPHPKPKEPYLGGAGKETPFTPDPKSPLLGGGVCEWGSLPPPPEKVFLSSPAHARDP